MILCLVTLVMGLEWDLSPVFDSFVVFEDEPALGQGQSALVERVRLHADGGSGPWHASIAWETNLVWRSDLAVGDTSVWLRAEDLNRNVHREEDFWVLQNLDRFAVSYEGDRIAMTLGRQAIGHGNGKIFNPSDIFAPLNPFRLNSEYKSGIDGLKLSMPFGQLSEAQALLFADSEGLAIALGRLGTYWRGVDLSLMAGETYDEWTVAWDVAMTAWGAAWNTEGVWRSRDARGDPVRALLGVSRRLPGEWDVSLETSYDSVSAEGPLGLLEFVTRPEVVHGEIYLRGHWHSGLSVSRQVRPLWLVTGLWIASLQDESGWVQAGVDWDVNPWSNLRFGFLVTYGSASSELGAFSDAAYAEYRIQF